MRALGVNKNMVRDSRGGGKEYEWLTPHEWDKNEDKKEDL